MQKIFLSSCECHKVGRVELEEVTLHLMRLKCILAHLAASLHYHVKHKLSKITKITIIHMQKKYLLKHLSTNCYIKIK